MDERTPIQIGVDLRPLPLALSDGETWMFNPDPDKDFFAKIAKIGKDLQKVEGDTEDMDWGAIDEIRNTLAGQLTERVEDFVARNYGLAVLSAMAAAYAESVVAIPTEQSSPSGKGQRGTGATK